MNYLKDAAHPDYSRIYVAGGNYNKETMPWVLNGATYKKPFYFFGGYNAAFNSNSAGSFPTAIKAGGATQIFNLNGVAGTIEGFDFSGVNQGAILIVDNEGATSYSFTVANNVFHDSSTSPQTPLLALLLAGSNTANFSSNTVRNNTVADTIVANFRGSVTATKNHFYGNNALMVMKCSVGAFVANNYLLGNTSNWIANPAGNCTFVNNTVARNTIHAGADNAVVAISNNGNQVANNLITNNAGNKTVQHLNGDTSLFEYNGLFNNNSDPAPLADNNVVCDPNYPTANGTKPTDVILGNDSPCIDKGKALSTVKDDYFGNSRPWDGNGDGAALPDPGAYESHKVVPPPPSDKCAGFSDVAQNDPNCEAIKYVKSIGAMTGNPDGTFAPQALLQRDQIAKIALETFKLFSNGTDYCAGKNPFPDVTSGAWSFQYICRGKQLGIITGYLGGQDAGYYRPGRSVNRVEFLALLLRNLSDPMPGIYSSSYQDVQSGQWYSGYAKYSYDHSLFVGSYLYPMNFTTRVEVAAVIFQLHNQGKI